MSYLGRGGVSKAKEVLDATLFWQDDRHCMFGCMQDFLPKNGSTTKTLEHLLERPSDLSNSGEIKRQTTSEITI